MVNQAINLGHREPVPGRGRQRHPDRPRHDPADGLGLIVDGYTELDLHNDINTLAAQPEAALGDPQWSDAVPRY